MGGKERIIIHYSLFTITYSLKFKPHTAYTPTSYLLYNHPILRKHIRLRGKPTI
jgi:hypothetical protein